MKVRTLGVLAAVGALGALPVAADADSPRDRATGGGQILIDPDSPPQNGALDTVAFTAQRERGASDDSGLADGQVQVNRRSGDALKFHGTVECLIVIGGKSEGKAYISGVKRGSRTEENPEGTPFELYIVDGGSGENERGGDQGLVWFGPETEENEPDDMFVGNFTPPEEDEFCGIEEDPTSKRQIPALARGNYQVYDANPTTESSARKSSSKSASSTSLSSLAASALK
jgi:hypothetical protein